jgi:hypothetical protein
MGTYNLFNCDWESAGALTTSAVTGANNIGLVWREETGRTVTHVGLNVSSVVGTPFLRATLCNINPTNYTPNSGSILSTGSMTNTFAAVTGWQWIPLIAPQTLLPNSGASLYITRASGGAQATVNTIIGTYGLQRLPYSLSSAGSTWSKLNGASVISVKFNDNSILPFTFPVSRSTTANTNSVSNPNEYGMEWTQEFNCQCIGIHASLRLLNNNSDVALCLYEKISSTGQNLLASGIINGGLQNLTSSQGMSTINFNPITLQNGKRYISSIRPLTTGNYTRVVRDFVDKNEREAVIYNASGVNRNTAGSPPTWNYSANGKDCFAITPIILTPTFERFNYFNG